MRFGQGLRARFGRDEPASPLDEGGAPPRHRRPQRPHRGRPPRRPVCGTGERHRRVHHDRRPSPFRRRHEARGAFGDQADTQALADLGEAVREHALVAPGLEARERAAHFGMVPPRAFAESAAQAGRVLEDRAAVRAGESALEDGAGLAGSAAQERPAERDVREREEVGPGVGRRPHRPAALPHGLPRPSEAQQSVDPPHAAAALPAPVARDAEQSERFDRGRLGGARVAGGEVEVGGHEERLARSAGIPVGVGFPGALERGTGGGQLTRREVHRRPGHRRARRPLRIGQLPEQRRRRLQLDACFLPPAERCEQASPVRPRERDVRDAPERRDE